MVTVIQESKLSSNSKTPSIHNLTTVGKDSRQGQGGGLLTLIHKSKNFSRKPQSPETLVEPHLEELMHRRLPLFSGSSDGDDGHPNTGRLQ